MRVVYAECMNTLRMYICMGPLSNHLKHIPTKIKFEYPQYLIVKTGLPMWYTNQDKDLNVMMALSCPVKSVPLKSYLPFQSQHFNEPVP